jgi:hypothetical protein
MLRLLPFSLAVGAVLLAPLTASAQAPTAPALTAPAPVVPATPKAHNHVNGKITDVDAVKKTVTITQHKKTTTLTVTDDTKIFKADDAKTSPTGTFADLVTGTAISARTKGDGDTLTVVSIHIRAPKTAAPAAPVAPAAPATPTAPVTPATP